MEDVVYYNELYDLYGELLTDKQRKYFEDYYFNNYSFSEMALEYDISRNAVFKQIHIVTDRLQEYEDILKLKSKRDKVMKILEDVPKEIRDKVDEVL